MRKLNFKAAFAALLLGVGLCTLAVPNAGAATVPLVNGDFHDTVLTTGLPGGWSVEFAAVPSGGYTQVVNGPYVGYYITDGPALGISYNAALFCVLNCPAGVTNSLSQQVNGLVVGNQYRVSLYATGYRSTWPGFGNGEPQSPPAPMTITLGEQTSGPISVPTYRFGGAPLNAYNWGIRTADFTYKGPGSSALFKIIQNVTGLTVGCIPCQEALFLANVVLEDLGPTGPTLQVQKALGSNRIANTDQFTVQIVRNGSSVVNATTNSTTTGTGSSVESGSGTTGVTTLVAGTSYVITEAASGTSRLGQYNSTLSCTDKAGANKPLALNTAFTLQDGEVVNCKITNSAKPATLTVRQLVQSPVPINLVPPFKFTYNGDNGWGSEMITNAALNRFDSTAAKPLTATNTATTVKTALPEPRWTISSFSCTDLTAADSGNRTGTLVTIRSTTVIVPASVVRAGANLRCTLLLGHLTP